MRADQELFGDPLPTYLTRFVGREQELSELTALVGSARMVTICGIGGSGKSRLAVEFARRLSRDPARGGFRDGVVWVPLVDVTEPEDRAPRGRGGARPPGSGRRLADSSRCSGRWRSSGCCSCSTTASRSPTRAPNLLDAAAPSLPTRVGAGHQSPSAGVRSRGVVRHPLPRPWHERAKSDAVALFIDRGTITSPRHELAEADSKAIRDICERLDGSPLAIELVASWIGVLSPRDLWETTPPNRRRARLRHSSGRRAAPQHRLGARQHLEVARRGGQTRPLRPGRLPRRLGPTGRRSSGWSEPGVAVGAHRSLLIQRMPDAAGGSRYHVHELVRDYAARASHRLGDESVEEVRARHFDYFLSLARARGCRPGHRRRAARARRPRGRPGQRRRRPGPGRSQRDRSTGRSRCRPDWPPSGSDSAPLKRSAALLTRVLDLPWEPSSPAAITREHERSTSPGTPPSPPTTCDLAELRFQEALTLSEQLADTPIAARSLRGLGSARRQSGDTAAGETSVQRSLALCRADRRRPGRRLVPV